MKNQYFGDVNDYRKYGLLRTLQSKGNGSLLVAWMLTLDDGGRDGGFRSHFGAPATWSKYDPDLFDGLDGLLRSARQPCVSLIEGSSLLPRASYFSAVAPDGRRERNAWRADLLRAADIDLVFVDPDIGIEVPSRPVGRKGSSKYIAWPEIEGLWEAGCSSLIYQHFRRERRESFAERMVSELRDRTDAPWTVALRTPHVLFLLAAQERHEARLREAVSSLPQRWNDPVEPMRLANGCNGRRTAPPLNRRGGLLFERGKMKDRTGEKIGWTAGWLGGFVWVFVLSIVFLFQEKSGQGLAGIALTGGAAISVVFFAPWRFPSTPYWKLMLAPYGFFYCLGSISTPNKTLQRTRTSRAAELYVENITVNLTSIKATILTARAIISEF